MTQSVNQIDNLLVIDAAKINAWLDFYLKF